MPAPQVVDPGRLADRNGQPVQIASGASGFYKLVSKYHSSTGGFADAWFTSSYYLNPYAVARGSLDDGTDIADGSKVNILNVDAQAVMALLQFRWVRDNASQPALTGQNPKGFLMGWYPDPILSGRDEHLGFQRAASAAGFARASNSSGIWVPLRTPDGSIEVSFPTSPVLRGSTLGTSSTTAQKNAQVLPPIEFLLRGAKRIMFLPSGSTSAPVFDAVPDDAQVVCQFIS